MIFTDIEQRGCPGHSWNFINIAVQPFDYTSHVLPANERMQWLMSHREHPCGDV